VADPAQVDRAEVDHARGGPQGDLDLVDHGLVDRVHQPPVDLPGGVFEHHEDRGGDGQADEGIGPLPADGYFAGAEQHHQGGEPVGAGMQPVSDQCR
jgi:hypothetical protein